MPAVRRLGENSLDSPVGLPIQNRRGVNDAIVEECREVATHDVSALMLIAAAGVMQGSFVVPMKFTKKWDWENAWSLFGFLGFVLLPGLLAAVTVPRLGEVLATAPRSNLLAAALLGLGWGCGSVCFGLGVKMLGIGLALSIILGLASALGSIIPWLTSPAKPLTYSILLWCGVLVMLAGVAVCSLAGQKRQAKVRSPDDSQGSRRTFLAGLAISIASGVLSCFMNLGFAYGAEVTRRAEELGAVAVHAPNVLWFVIMGGGFVANAIYCAYLMLTRRSWQKFASQTARNLSWVLVMAALWVGSLVAYGIGANNLGRLGPSVGWPILMSLNIISSNAWGAVTGEWSAAGRSATTTMIVGVSILLAAVVIFGWASTTT